MTGNLIIGQSGGGTAVINSSLVGAVREARRHAGIRHVFGMLNGIEGLLRGQMIDLSSQPDDVLDQLLSTPSSALGACRFSLEDEDLDPLLEVFRQKEVRFVVYIGGNDSAETAHKLAQASARRGFELHVVAVPKTIDNDLPVTDHSPGYGSAARFLAMVTMELDLDAWAMRSVEPIRFLEVKGRNSGWLAAACALGRARDEMAPHVVLTPERPFVEDAFLSALEDSYRRHTYAVVVVPETLRDTQGKLVGALGASWRDQFGHEYGAGLEGRLVGLIAQRMGLRARYDKPGFLHKTSLQHVSAIDRSEAYLVGEEGVRAVLRGCSDMMVVLRREVSSSYRCSVDTVDLAQVAGRERVLPDHFVSADGREIHPDFLTYAMPLIGDPLPRFAHLRW